MPRTLCATCGRLIARGRYCDGCRPSDHAAAYHDPLYRQWQSLAGEHRGEPCPVCGRPMDPATVDHVVPLSEGGPNDPSNWRYVCGPCNYGKRGRPANRRKPPHV